MNKTASEIFAEMRGIITDERPELGRKLFVGMSTGEFADFLNRHFPIDGGWDGKSIQDGPTLLRQAIAQ
jgi:hypothetical protein